MSISMSAPHLYLYILCIYMPASICMSISTSIFVSVSLSLSLYIYIYENDAHISGLFGTMVIQLASVSQLKVHACMQYDAYTPGSTAQLKYSIV